MTRPDNSRELLLVLYRSGLDMAVIYSAESQIKYKTSLRCITVSDCDK